jgi:hypothetical protein
MTQPVWNRPVGGVATWRFLLRVIGCVFLFFAFLIAEGGASKIVWADHADAWFGLLLCWLSTL